MTDLVAFLKDRLDELQWVAESVTAHTDQGWDPPVWVQDDDYKHNTLIVDKTWLLADVAAKRQIIEWQTYMADEIENDGARAAWESIVRLLASVWSDHPDYAQNWA